MLGSKMDADSGFGLTGTAGAITFLVIAFGFVGGILFVLKLSAEQRAVAGADGGDAAVGAGVGAGAV